MPSSKSDHGYDEVSFSDERRESWRSGLKISCLDLVLR